MSILQIQTIPKHDYKLIVVPSEKIEKQISDYQIIQSGNEKYKIVEWVTILRTEPMPSSLMLLATGKDIFSFEVWNAYPNSNKLIFFICELIR